MHAAQAASTSLQNHPTRRRGGGGAAATAAAGSRRHPPPTPAAPVLRRPLLLGPCCATSSNNEPPASPSPPPPHPEPQPARIITRRAALLTGVTTAAATAAAAASSSPAAAALAASSSEAGEGALFDPLAAAASALQTPSPTRHPSPPLPRIPRAASIPRAPALRGLSAVVRGTRQLDGRHRGTPPPRGSLLLSADGNDNGNTNANAASNPSDRTRGGEAIADLSRFWRAGVTSFETSDAFGGAETLLGQFLRLEPKAAAPGAAKIIATLALDGRGGSGGSGQLARADMRPAALELRVRAACARLGVASLDHVQLAWRGGDAPGRGGALSAAAGGGGAGKGLFGRRKGGGAHELAGSSSNTPLWLDALLALQDLRVRRGGLVKGVGVVGFSAARLLRALDSGVDVATNLVPLSVMDRRAVSQRGLSALCAERRVALLARGCLLGGFLQDRFLGVPASAARLDTDAKLEYGRVVSAAGGWDRLQEQLEVLSRLGKKHGASASSVALRWALQQESVAAVVVGARNASHVGDLRRAFAFELREDELLDLDAAYESAAQPTGDVGEWERGGVW